MTDDEIIDAVLDEFKTTTSFHVLNYLSIRFPVAQENGLTIDKIRLLILKMEKLRLISIRTPHYYQLETKGYDVIEVGGWLKYLEQEKKERIKNEAKELLEIDLAKSNIEANRINKEATKRNKNQNIFIICATILNLILLVIQLYIMSKSK